MPMSPIAGTFTATGQSNPFAPEVDLRGARGGRFNVTLSGTFVATVKLERTFDNGSTWHVVAKSDFAEAAFTAPVSFMVEEPESGVQYRVNCTAYTSGTVTYRISQ